MVFNKYFILKNSMKDGRFEVLGLDEVIMGH
jgi:hypothetical protein